jgi:hypothetical protein
MTESAAFEPGKYLSVVNGNDYLEVKWRLVWLRNEHPDAQIETELMSHDGNRAVFRARVAVPNGGSATGWGTEDGVNFPNYLEAAETKALGRALAALGFGTQFCPDFDFGADEGRVVDAPVALKREPTNVTQGTFDRERSAVDQEATYRQRNLIGAIVRELKMDQRMLNELALEVTGKGANELNRKEASSVIEHLKDRQQAQTPRIA